MQSMNFSPREFTPSQKVNEQVLEHRCIETNVPDSRFCDNRVTTTNSNILTFVPVNILGQLSKPANIYFIFIGILQMIPPISNSGGRPLVLIPLSCVMLTVLIKDAMEEYTRYKKDQADNNHPVQVLGPDGYELIPCEQVMVGDIVRVSKDELLPCDIVLLQTPDPKGRTYIETRNLDGENHLKTKRVPHSTKLSLNKLSLTELYSQRLLIQCQKPNQYMNSFNGNINIRGQILPLTNNQLLLKGSTLKNVIWSCGVCVYSGKETKLSLNSAKFKGKRSELDKDVNRKIIIVMTLQLVLSLIAACLNSFLQQRNIPSLFGLEVYPFWVVAGTWWLIMSYFVPISLVVSMEMVKLLQGLLLTQDIRMYSKMTGTMPAVNNSTVNQSLGKVKYIFTDKTGTLTSNIMNFKALSLHGKKFGNPEGLFSHQELNPLYQQLNITNVQFQDPQFLKIANNYKDFLELLVVCNDIVVEKDQYGSLTYNSSSPDEIALVNFAKLCGYELAGDEHDKVVIYDRKNDRILKFRILATLDFSSDRKRMSVIVQNSLGEIRMYTKGADTTVSPLLRPHSEYLKETQAAIDNYSHQGLRTLMLAWRSISFQEYHNWKIIHSQAATSIHNRESLLEQSYTLIQKDLVLMGCTAVEDKLQDKVPETIATLKKCGIAFYMLTGDKRETAVNIGRSCGLIGQKTKLISPPQNQDMAIWLSCQSLQEDSVLLLNAAIPLPKVPLLSCICYRCTPTQKQRVVKSVKDQTDALCLAIGDGSNDVNMIVTADVGIGIRGKQGNEVGRVADFVIGEFSLLGPLVLYYGREWNRRNSKLVNYNFFKNSYHVLAIFGFGAVSFFSGTILFEMVMYQFFNSFFTAVPIVIWALADDEYSWEESLLIPKVYLRGLNGHYFNTKTFWKNMALGAFCGVFSIWLVEFSMEPGVVDSYGRVSYRSQIGMIVFFNMVIVVNAKVVLMSHGLSLALLVALFISYGSYVVIYAIYMNFFNNEIHESFTTQLTTVRAWCIQLLLSVLLLGSDFIFKKTNEYNKQIRKDKELNLCFKQQ